MHSERVKKILRITGVVLTWLLVVLTVFMMVFTIVSVNVFDNANRDIFGYKAFIVMSDSMAATDFKAGDLIFVKEVDASTLKEGDIISFQAQADDPKQDIVYGQTVTHKIRRVNEDGTFTTYGTTTGSDDLKPVGPSFVYGKYTGKLMGVGAFFHFLKTTPGYLLCILLPFLVLIAVQGVNVYRLFKKYKQEQMADLEEERRRLAEEREESQRLVAELRAMKEEMERERASGCSQEETEE